jgi:hypothetical protein
MRDDDELAQLLATEDREHQAPVLGAARFRQVVEQALQLVGPTGKSMHLRDQQPRSHRSPTEVRRQLYFAVTTATRRRDPS